MQQPAEERLTRLLIDQLRYPGKSDLAPSDPCESLPTDLWMSVVSLCVERDPEVALILSSVSRGWRTSILGMTPAWSHLRLKFKARDPDSMAPGERLMRKAATWMERSRGNLRTLEIEDLQSGAEESLARLLGPAMANLRVLRLVSDDLRAMTSPWMHSCETLQELSIEHGWPRLKRWARSDTSEEQMPFACDLLHPTCCTLKKLKISGDVGRNDLAPTQTRQLRSLHFEGVCEWLILQPVAFAQPIRDKSPLHQLLSDSPLLDECDICVWNAPASALPDVGYNADTELMLLPEVRSWTQSGNMEPLIQCDLPKLANLILEDEDTTLTARALVKHPGVRLEKLQMFRALEELGDGGALVECVRHMRTIRELSLSAPLSDVKQLLHMLVAEALLSPRLTTLDLSVRLGSVAEEEEEEEIEEIGFLLEDLAISRSDSVATTTEDLSAAIDRHPPQVADSSGAIARPTPLSRLEVAFDAEKAVLPARTKEILRQHVIDCCF